MDITSDDTLTVVSSLVEEFHHRDIRYCHWKSNEHLDAALRGDTDLDILVDREQAAQVRDALREAGFKPFSSHRFAKYPAMEDYLGFDEHTGTLVHVHLHYRLVLGGKRQKDYRLPWGETVLSRRVRDDSGIYRSDEVMELLLLLLRYAFKIRLRDYPKALLGRSYLSDDFHREYEWLIARVDEEELVSLASEFLDDDAASIICRILETEPTLWKLRRLRKCTKRELSIYRTYSAPEALLRGQWREGFLALQLLNQRLQWPRPMRRTIPTGGVVVALIGADGSGKSTMSSNVVDWLSWKLDVHPVYFGSGDGPASLVRMPLIFVWWVVEVVRSIRGVESENTSGMEGGDGPGSLPKRIWMSFWALTLAYEKRRKLRGTWRARDRGMAVVTDRFPQNQIMGFNDGPLLDKWRYSDSRIKRWLSRWERIPYQWAEAHPPDLVIRLQVDSDTALERKPEMTLESVEQRVAAIESLEFADSQVVEVDATAAMDEVEREIKRAVWEAI